MPFGSVNAAYWHMMRAVLSEGRNAAVQLMDGGVFLRAVSAHFGSFGAGRLAVRAYLCYDLTAVRVHFFVGDFGLRFGNGQNASRKIACEAHCGGLRKRRLRKRAEKQTAGFLMTKEGCFIMRIVQGRSVMLQAHRGFSAECPENTMAAFRSAVELGYDLIELDPKFTRDNRCVILHDRTIARTGRDGRACAANIPIADMTLNEARAYEFGGWFDKKFAGEPLPLLEDVLLFAKANDIPLKLDNVIESFTPEQTTLLMDLVAKTGAEAQAGFTCTRPEYAAAVAARFPKAVIHYDGPADEDRLRAVTAVLKENPLVVWLRYPNRQTAWCKTPPVDDARVALVRALGARLGLWIIDDENEFIDACLRFSPDIVETAGFIKPDKPCI